MLCRPAHRFTVSSESGAGACARSHARAQFVVLVRNGLSRGLPKSLNDDDDGPAPKTLHTDAVCRAPQTLLHCSLSPFFPFFSEVFFFWVKKWKNEIGREKKEPKKN